MDIILDYIFYHSLRIGLVCIVLFLIGLGLGKFNPFKNHYHNIIYRYFCYSLFIQWIILAFFLSPHYGYADQLNKAYSNGRQLLLLEETRSSSPGEGGIDSYYRLYAVDMNTGKRLHRRYLGNDADLLYLSGKKSLVREKHEYSVLQINDFQVSKSYLLDKMHFNYPRLKPGVSAIRYDDTLLEIDSKNGRKYYLEPFTGKLSDKKPDIMTAHQPDYRVTSNAIEYFNSSNRQFSRILQFKSTGNGSLKRIDIANHARSMPAFDLIEPKFLGYYPDEQIAIIVSYKTTDKKSYIITAFRLMDARILWQLEQGVLDKSDYANNNATLTILMKHEDDLIFNSGGLLIRADSKTGKIKWRAQL